MNYKGKTMRSIRNCLAIVACLAFGTNFAQADYDVTYSYGGGYFSFESGDIDPGLAFGHGFLAPGSGAGCKFDFWIAVDGVIDGTGVNGGGGASTVEPNFGVPGGNDTFLGTIVLNEDGADSYNGGTGLVHGSITISDN